MAGIPQKFGALRRSLEHLPNSLLAMFWTFALTPVVSLSFLTPPWAFAELAAQPFWYTFLAAYAYWLSPILLCVGLARRSSFFLPAFGMQCGALLAHAFVGMEGQAVGLQILRVTMIAVVILFGLLLSTSDALTPLLRRKNRFWRSSPRLEINCAVMLEVADTRYRMVVENLSLTGLAASGEVGRLIDLVSRHGKGTRATVHYERHNVSIAIPVEVAWYREDHPLLLVGFRALDVEATDRLILATAQRAENRPLRGKAQRLLARTSVYRGLLALWTLSIALAVGLPACGAKKKSKPKPDTAATETNGGIAAGAVQPGTTSGGGVAVVALPDAARGDLDSAAGGEGELSAAMLLEVSGARVVVPEGAFVDASVTATLELGGLADYEQQAGLGVTVTFLATDADGVAIADDGVAMPLEACLHVPLGIDPQRLSVLSRQRPGTSEQGELFVQRDGLNRVQLADKSSEICINFSAPFVSFAVLDESVGVVVAAVPAPSPPSPVAAATPELQPTPTPPQAPDPSTNPPATNPNPDPSQDPNPGPSPVPTPEPDPDPAPQPAPNPNPTPAPPPAPSSPPVLVGIEVSPATAELAAGTSLTFRAVGIYDDASNREIGADVTWTSAAGAVATIGDEPEDKGLAVARSPGTTEIAASLAGLRGTANLTVTTARLMALAVTPTAPQLPAGTGVQLVVTGTLSDGTMQDFTHSATWQSNATNIAVVSDVDPSKGLVSTATAVGEAEVTASIGELSAKTTVTVVSARLESIAALPSSLRIARGTSAAVMLQGTYSDGSVQDVTALAEIVPAEPSVAALEVAPPAGTIRGVNVGDTVLSLRFGGFDVEVPVAVTPARLVSISVSPAAIVTPIGISQRLEALGAYTDGTSQVLSSLVTWQTSDASVATISNAAGTEGELSGLKVGDCIVTATASGVSAMTNATIEAARLDSLAITPSNVSLQVGSAYDLVLLATYSDGSTQEVSSNGTWSVLGPMVASVSNAAGSAGRVSALAAGRTEVRARFGAIEAASILEVTPPPKRRRRIDLSVPTPVSDYQVQIVLTPSNFDFAAAPDGASLRFEDGNANALAHWTQSWSPPTEATIWVKVPDAGASSIFMSYGDSSLTSISCAACMPRIFNGDFELPLVSPSTSSCNGATVSTQVTGWTATGVSGDCAYATSSPGGVTSCGNLPAPSGKQGQNYMACSDAGGGTWKSRTFTLMTGAERIRFLRAGGANGGGVQLRSAVSGSALCTANNGSNTNVFFVDNCRGLSAYAGTQVYLEVVDNARQNKAWNRVAVDDFHQATAAGVVLDRAATEPVATVGPEELQP